MTTIYMSMPTIYGVLTDNNIHIDVSATLQGAKNYATRHDYTIVSIRYGSRSLVDIVAHKVDNKWQDF